MSILYELSTDHERQIIAWIEKEDLRDTVVRKELIYWLAENLIRRDSIQGQLAPDFVSGFLSGHPDLKKALRIPSQPSHIKLKADKPTRVSAFDRLKQRMRDDRREALFSDSPPPPRQPAPYPEGELIYRCNDRYIVRHGDTVTKYTTKPDGIGINDRPNEASVLDFVRTFTTIPVPKVISRDWDRITMEYIEGQTLQQAWPILTPDQRSNVLAQLSDYLYCTDAQVGRCLYWSP